MRVVQATTKYPPARGGSERHVQDLAVGLRARGVDARIVTTDLRRHRHPVLHLRPEESAGDGVPVVRLPVEEAGTRRLRIPGMAEALTAEAPDVLVCWDIWSPAFATAVEVSRAKGVPLVANPIFHERDERWNDRLREIVARIPEQAMVVFHTPWEEKRLAELGFGFERTAFHCPAVDLHEFDTACAPPPPAGLPEGRVLVGFVGRLTHSKGIDVLLRSFARVREQLPAAFADRLHLAIAGFVDSDECFEGEARELGIADCTSFLPDCTREEILGLLRAAQLFVLPSRAESFGIVVLEAWASDCLVLVSDRTALPYVVDHGGNGLVAPLEGFDRGLREALLQLDTAEGRALVAAGRRTVHARFGREQQIDELLGILDEARQTRLR